ncbi:hypothetical protein DM01DRAFT_1335100 [Hesseltinella vesiculosa]|uniref:histidine kinase n=1 Tax=Hesseltinella vesiculosa TaxID=101127 RepID=A0A1X2GK67_9FUNG|nr:hypothetical protein DM01DRAFT_1335100 [Hesseltinella vesiculosa]
MHEPTVTKSEYHAQLYNKQKQQSQGIQDVADLPEWQMTQPNLYKTSLRLCREFTIQAWWRTLIDILTDRHSCYATQLTLCLPQDAHDPQTGVWGLKAAFQQHSGSTCFQQLQPLDHDHINLAGASTIHRLLQRQDMVVLSREYRSSAFASPKLSHPFLKSKRPLVHSKILPVEHRRTASDLGADYDDYEQQQPSPWSHSPLPSPALLDPNVNPFFQSAPSMDHDAFNPDAAHPPQSPHTSFPMPLSNTQTIVHIPLLHTTQDDPANPTPAAILSFLSPIVPYPVALQKYIRSLSPFITATLTNALAYDCLVQANAVQHQHHPPDRQLKRQESQDDASSSDALLPSLSPPLPPPSLPPPDDRPHDIPDNLRTAPKSTLLRLLIDGIAIHIFMCSSTTGQVTWVNQRILQYTGRAFADHLGPSWLSHMHPDDQTICAQAWKHAFAQGSGFTGEYRLRRFDGHDRYFLWRIVPLRDIKGRIIHWLGTCTDVHDQRAAKESHVRQMEIQSNERKYRLLAEAIPQIVFTFSPDAGLTYANEKWSTYSGQPFERTAGLGFVSHVHPEDRHKLQLPDLSPEKTAGITWHTEVRLMGVDGQYCWFLVKCISVDELASGEVRWFGTCTDINDQKLLEHKLKEAHSAAQKSTESKTRFLSNMSHEIRTPLIGITGMLNFLLDTELTPEQLDYAHTIQQSAESLLVVINDILDLSKVEAGMMKLEIEPFSLVTMIEDANELLSTLAVQKGLELSFWVDDNVPPVVLGDRVRLRQVLLNLVGNAIKFTSQGEVFTQCTVSSNQHQPLVLLFEVIDTGTGFDAKEQDIMFKPFSQVDSSSTRKHGGSGLGLVISQQLIELHGGEMKCTSKKGQGSSFTFTAKFDVPDHPTLPHPHTPSTESNNPFYRTDAYTVVHDPAFISANDDDSGNVRVFAASPIAHSKKHSQAQELPVSSSDPKVSFRHALYQRHASSDIHLQSPPSRRSSLADEQERQDNALAKRNGLFTSAPPSPSSSSSACSTLASSTISKTELLAPPPLPQRNSCTMIPDLISPSTSVTFPLRTPTHTHPLGILIVCQWKHSCDTMEKHVRSILNGLLIPRQHCTLDVTRLAAEAQQLVRDPAKSYDYILINLPAEQLILELTFAISQSHQQRAHVLIVTTPMQRSLITELASHPPWTKLPKSCGFVFKPLKRSKLNWYFGVSDKQASVMDATSAPDASHRSANIQRQTFRKMLADVGGQGFRILLVEDNLVNQKVMTRYLERVGLTVELANDGQECVDRFMENPFGYYSLVLCDLFMPVKDGYEATKEIRAWEAQNVSGGARLPIVALSANVMSNVASQCLEAGFSTYISKPVNFAILSDVIRTYLLPIKK